MRFAAYRQNGVDGLAAAEGDGPFHGYAASDSQHPGSLVSLVAGGSDALLAAGRALLAGPAVDLGAVEDVERRITALTESALAALDASNVTADAKARLTAMAYTATRRSS